MSVQLSIPVRNARANATETTIGTSPLLMIRTQAPPANCAAADVGTVLCTIQLPANWLADAVSGIKTLIGTWSQPFADAFGTAAHFRIYDSAGLVCHMQGTVTVTGAGGDMTLADPLIYGGHQVTITSFQLTELNA